MPETTEPQPTAAPRSSTWKMWWPVTMMLACSFLSYLDRQTLSVLSPTILAELKMDVRTYGEIVRAFSLAYMVANPIWGVILDRIGLRVGMALAVTIWTVACGMHSMLYGFVGFVVARAVLGFGEGATFPGGLRTAADWLPERSQSRGMAVAYSGGSLGAIVTPLLVTPIAVRHGWRAAFIVTGVAGLLWVLTWRHTVDFSAIAAHRRTERLMLPNPFERRFWSLVASYGLAALPIGLIIYLAPIYLDRVLGMTQWQIGRVIWLPPLGWEIGYFFWGWLADRFAARNPRPTWLFFTLAFIGLPQIATFAFRSPAIVLGLMVWAMFVASGFVVVSLRTSALAYPREQTGLVAGIGAGSWSAVVAIVTPTLGHMFDMHRYANVFLICGLVPVLGTLLWWTFTLPDARFFDVDITK